MSYDENETERWADCPGYPGRYLVSDRGRVKNVRANRLLTGHVTKKGYLQVRLRAPGRRPKCFFVHRLVATAFHGLPPKGHVVDHISGKKLDCAARNVEWVTPSENMKRAYKLGLMTPHGPQGERHPHAKLTEEKVRAIRTKRQQGHSFRKLAREFGISKEGARKAVVGETWRHVAA